MSLKIAYPEIFGVTESSVSLAFDVVNDEGPVDAEARVVLAGEVRAVSHGAAATRFVRIEGLEPDSEYPIAIEVDGAATAEPGKYFDGAVRTQPAPRADMVASFATLNDLHFGEPRMGGTMTDDHEYGEAAEGFPVVRAEDTEVPYSQFMNEDAIAEINSTGVDLAVIKGDIADRGLPEQFETAARVFSRLAAPHHAFLGNHDYLGRHNGHPDVDGYALLGQPAAPRVVEVGGWRLVLLETSEPGVHPGVFPAERLAWLEEALREGHESRMPTLILMHHQPVPPEHSDSYPNTIGLDPEHSLRFFDLIGRSSQVKGVLIGHTHRNRVRRYPPSGATPYIEVSNPKDYPGGWAHYCLYEDGSFRQEVRRTASARALEHSTRCRGLFRGFYRDYTLGQLAERSLIAGG